MTVSKIQMAQPAIVKRNPRNRSVPDVTDTQQALQNLNRPNTRRCLFGLPAPGENLRIAKMEIDATFQRNCEKIRRRFGYDIATEQPVEESSEIIPAAERLQEAANEEAASVDAGDNAKAECSGDVKDTVNKTEIMCNGGSVRNPGKEASSSEKSHRVKPYDRANKQTHITDFMKEVKKPARSSIESKEKH